MNEERTEKVCPQVYGLVVEFDNQAPLLMESEGEMTDPDRLLVQVQKMKAGNRITRWAIVRLRYHSGNELLLKDLERMQE